MAIRQIMVAVKNEIRPARSKCGASSISSKHGDVAVEPGKRRGLFLERLLSLRVILIGPDGKKSQQQAVDDAEILEIVPEDVVKAK